MTNKPIASTVIQNPNNLSQRDMIKYFIDNKDIMDLQIENTQKWAENELAKHAPHWLPIQFKIVNNGTYFDKNDNLLMDFYVEIVNE